MLFDEMIQEEIQEYSEEGQSSVDEKDYQSEDYDEQQICEGQQEINEADLHLKTPKVKYKSKPNAFKEQDECSIKKSQTAYVSSLNIESLYMFKKKKQYIRTKSENFFTVNSRELQINKLSKSYVYIVKGLSDEIENFESLSQGVLPGSRIGTFGLQNNNYNSMFFEKDMNLDQYKQSIKDALAVQFQKEKNISHEIIKTEYDKWVQNFQNKFQKTSPHKKTIVFDLDETLVRAQEYEFENGQDARIRVIESEKQDFMIYVKWRPNLEQTLKKLKEHFELILFTAASNNYANIVLQTFQGHKYFDHILARNHCLFIQQYKVHIKDLQILTQGRRLQDIIIIDNKIESYSSHLENGIPIKSYYGEKDDDRLPCLVKHLMKLKDVYDVRPHILKDFFLNEITNNKKSNQDDVIDSFRIMECVQKDRERYQSLKNTNRNKVDKLSFQKKKRSFKVELQNFDKL